MKENIDKKDVEIEEQKGWESIKNKWFALMAGCYGPPSPQCYVGKHNNKNEARAQIQIPKLSPNKKNPSPSRRRLSLEDALLLTEEKDQQVIKMKKNQKKEEKLKPLISLMQKADREDEEKITESNRGKGIGGVCRVCAQRKRNAAFIPCGHAFCRVCSRELWIDRRSCPICDEAVVEILDIL